MILYIIIIFYAEGCTFTITLVTGSYTVYNSSALIGIHNSCINHSVGDEGVNCLSSSSMVLLSSLPSLPPFPFCMSPILLPCANQIISNLYCSFFVVCLTVPAKYGASAHDVDYFRITKHLYGSICT